MTLKKSADTIPSLCINQGYGVRQRGILLVNLGSPASTSVTDVRRYLNEFLMDPYVIDSPWLMRKFVVSGFILPFRPQRTAHAYDASGNRPDRRCCVIPRRFALRSRNDISMPVELAMRYGEPTIRSGVAKLHRCRHRRSPVDPDVSAPCRFDANDVDRSRTNGNSRDRTRASGSTTLPPFFDEPRYIDALAAIDHAARRRPIRNCCCSAITGLPERHITRCRPDRQSLPEVARTVASAHRPRTRRAIATRFSPRHAPLPRGWG